MTTLLRGRARKWNLMNNYTNLGIIGQRTGNRDTHIRSGKIVIDVLKSISRKEYLVITGQYAMGPMWWVRIKARQMGFGTLEAPDLYVLNTICTRIVCIWDGTDPEFKKVVDILRPELIETITL